MQNKSPFSNRTEPPKKRTTFRKIIRYAYISASVVVLLVVAYQFYLRITTGRPMTNLLLYYLLLTAPYGIYRMISFRNVFNDSPQHYNKILLRSILVALLIMVVVVVVAAFIAMNR